MKTEIYIFYAEEHYLTLQFSLVLFTIVISDQLCVVTGSSSAVPMLHIYS